MRTVFKYPVPITDTFTLRLPDEAEVLSVAVQSGSVYLWALLDPSQATEPRRFRLAGTGHPITEELLIFIGTVLLHDGALVFHLFEVLGGNEGER